MRHAWLAIVFVTFTWCREKPPPPESAPAPFWKSNHDVVSKMKHDEVYAYLSGHVANSHNHPAIYANLGRKDLTVVGREGRAVFTLAKGDSVEQALAAYLQLVGDCGMVDERDARPADPQKKVVVRLNDILPSGDEAAKVFNPKELEVLRHVSPVGEGYGYFSGNRGGAHDAPTIYAFLGNGYQLVVIGRDVEESFDLAKHQQAFARYRSLLKERGFPRAQSQ